MQLTKQRKMLLSGGLTALSFVLALLARRPWCWLSALAMAVSTVGDGLLAGYPKCFAPVRDKLKKGGVVFFFAHVLYIAALALCSGQSLGALLPRFSAPFAVFAALTVLHGAAFYFPVPSRPPLSFFAAAFGYLFTVGVHAAAAVCVYGQMGGALLLNVFGAALFYLSDAILLAQRYGGFQSKRAGALIWITYVPAQLLLMLGFFLTAR